jgi:hypothetical protein
MNVIFGTKLWREEVACGWCTARLFLFLWAEEPSLRAALMSTTPNNSILHSNLQLLQILLLIVILNKFPAVRPQGL